MIDFRTILEHDNKYQSGDWNEYIKDFISTFFIEKDQTEFENTEGDLSKVVNAVLIQYLDWKQDQDVISPRELLIDTIQNLCNNLPNVYPHLDYTAEDYLNKAVAQVTENTWNKSSNDFIEDQRLFHLHLLIAILTKFVTNKKYISWN